MKTVTLEIPEEDFQKRKPGLHDNEEERVISLHGGPSIAFTKSTVRVYNPDHNTFVELMNTELIQLLATAYDIEI